MGKMITFCFISAFISALLFIKSYKKITNIEFKFNWRNTVIILLFSLVVSISNLYSPNILRVIIGFLMSTWLLFIIFKESIITTLFTSGIIYLITMASEILFSILVVSSKIVDIEMINNSYLIKVSFTICTYLLVYYIATREKTIKYINYIKSRISKIAGLNLVMYTIILLLDVTIVIMGINYNDINTFRILMIVMTIIFLISFFLTKTFLIKSTLEINNENLVKNIKVYEKIVGDYRILKHNLVNDLLTIKTTEPDKVNEQVDYIISKYHKDMALIDSVKEIPYGIKGLIYLKLKPIENAKVNFVINSNINDKVLSNLGKRKYNIICNVIGICLDNAIHAVNNYRGKDKSIFISLDDVNNEKYITIANTFSNEINLDEIGNKDYSTKEQKSGLGLYWVKKTKVEISQKIVDNVFITRIKIN